MFIVRFVMVLTLLFQLSLTSALPIFAQIESESSASESINGGLVDPLFFPDLLAPFEGDESLNRSTDNFGREVISTELQNTIDPTVLLWSAVIIIGLGLVGYFFRK